MNGSLSAVSPGKSFTSKVSLMTGRSLCTAFGKLRTAAVPTMKE